MKKYVCLLLALFLCVGTALPASAASETAYYGRDWLAKQANAADLLYAYDLLANGIVAGEEKITVDSTAHPLSVDDGKRVVEACINDRGGDFWLDTVTTYASTTVKYFEPVYFAGLKGKTSAFNDALNAVYTAAKLGSLTTDRDKALALHDALCRHVEYDTKAPNCHSAYGALVDKAAVCDGYAEAYQALLQKAGISAYRITGVVATSSGDPLAHAWLLVRLDGAYYLSDVTWDDYGSLPDEIHHEYFACTTAVMGEDHTVDADLLLPVPSCTATAADWFVTHDATATTSYAKDKFAKQLKANGYVCVGLTGKDRTTILDWFVSSASDLAKACDMSGTMGLSYYKYGREVHFYLYVLGDMTNDAQLGAADVTKLARVVGGLDVAGMRDVLAGNVDDTDGKHTVTAADVTKLARFASGIDLNL